MATEPTGPNNVDLALCMISDAWDLMESAADSRHVVSTVWMDFDCRLQTSFSLQEAMRCLRNCDSELARQVKRNVRRAVWCLRMQERQEAAGIVGTRAAETAITSLRKALGHIIALVRVQTETN